MALSRAFKTVLVMSACYYIFQRNMIHFRRFSKAVIGKRVSVSGEHTHTCCCFFPLFVENLRTNNTQKSGIFLFKPMQIGCSVIAKN